MNSTEDKELETTPEYELKPQLVFLGRFLGMDLYIDVSGQAEPYKKRDLAESVFKSLIEKRDTHYLPRQAIAEALDAAVAKVVDDMDGETKMRIPTELAIVADIRQALGMEQDNV